jgi:Lrp/AsnC family transcriptional regulator for asnA, asnC and gidA
MSSKPGVDKVALDGPGALLIEALQRDGRRSYRDLAQEVGLSEAAVRNRVQRLLDSGIINIVAVTDPSQLGFARQALVGVRVTHRIHDVAEALRVMEDVCYVVVVSGRYDLIAEVVCESDDHMIEALERIRSTECVSSIESMGYLKIHKQTFDEGVRF